MEKMQEMMRWWEIQQFYAKEATLLDERRYEEWLALLESDIHYFVPIARNLRREKVATEEYTGEGQTAWFDEGLDTLQKRVAQLKTGIHWIEEPVSRYTRVVSGILAEPTEKSNEIAVKSRFMLYQNRLQDEVSLYAGSRWDILRNTPEGLKLASRKVYLSQSVLLGKALAFFF